MARPNKDGERFVRDPECYEMFGMCQAQRDNEERAGRFPRRVRLSKRMVGWWSPELRDYATKLLADRDNLELRQAQLAERMPKPNLNRKLKERDAAATV